MAVALGVIVALSFGSGDFLGGSASRSAPTINVLLVVQCVALVGAVGYALAFGGSATAHDLWLGGAAGALNVVGLGCLFAGLATGRMGLVAPLTAVVAACIPVGWGLAHDEHLSRVTTLGIVLAVGSAGVIAHERTDPNATSNRTTALALAVTAGAFFGSSLVVYAHTSDDSGAWPVLAGRVTGTAVVVVAIAAFVRRWSIDPVPRRLAAGAGLLDVTATALLLVAIRRGLLAEVAPVSALGPAFTVMLAWLVLHEPVRKLQITGLVVAFTGLVMIAAG